MKALVTQYKWSGKWGPFKIKTVCDECELSQLVIGDLIKDKFRDKPVSFEIKEWLPNWWRVIWKGGWHAPLFFVNNKLIMQGKTIDLKKLEDGINKALKNRGI